MACAIEAAGRGKRVVVIEKTSRVGGTLHTTGGHMSAGGTRRQAQMGIADSPEQHFADVMRICGNTADEALVRLACDLAPATLDWLDDLGFDWEPDTPRLVFGHVPYQTARTAWGREAGKSILNVLEPLYRRYEAEGLIETWLGSTVGTLLVDEAGAVVGATVQRGNTLETVTATYIILATGGYAANAARFARYHPALPRLISTAEPASEGDGLDLAEAAGGYVRFTDRHIASIGGVELEPGSGRADYWAAWAMVFTSQYRMPRDIYVNERGERFMNEEILSPDERERIIGQQPGGRFWVILDETGLTQSEPLIRNWPTERLKAAATEGNFMWRANSLPELAQQTGLPAEALTLAVANYNHAVAQGSGDPQGRTYLETGIVQPPYYALLCYLTSLISFGGLSVDEQLRVVRADSTPIPNLYAAGELLGAGATSGNAFCGGMLVTPALSFGRYLGLRL
jgi:succinate dehydrogenase/fumarate reductase flavoprotein subunit